MKLRWGEGVYLSAMFFGGGVCIYLLSTIIPL